MNVRSLIQIEPSANRSPRCRRSPKQAPRSQRPRSNSLVSRGSTVFHVSWMVAGLVTVNGNSEPARVAFPIRTISLTKGPLIFSRSRAGMVAEFVKVSTTLEVPPGVVKMVQVAGQEVCLANVDGKCYAIGNVCTHEE